MYKISTTAFLGIIALAITGCGSSDNSQSVSPAPSTPPIAVSPSPVKPITPQPPVIAQNPSGTVYLAPSLIQPTNANQRVKQVAKGRRDPFAALFAPVSTPIPVSIAPPTSSSATNNSQQSASGSSNANNRRQPNSTVAARNSGSTNNQTSNPVKVNASNQSSPNQATPPGTPSTSPINPLPPSGLPGNNLPPAPPEQLAPQLAQNVTVMGVIQIGETTQAIVQVPNEATSRYVQVGQRLSNGQVLVKRIEMNEGAEPLVILEQYGVEVAKAVGEEPANQNDGQTPPTAALPSPAAQNITTQAAIPKPAAQNITTQADILAVPPPPNTPAVEAN